MQFFWRKILMSFGLVFPLTCSSTFERKNIRHSTDEHHIYHRWAAGISWYTAVLILCVTNPRLNICRVWLWPCPQHWIQLLLIDLADVNIDYQGRIGQSFHSILHWKGLYFNSRVNNRDHPKATGREGQM